MIQLCFSFLTSQIIENVRRQSVEGLALPFLTNWMLGTVDTYIVNDNDSSSQ